VSTLVSHINELRAEVVILRSEKPATYSEAVKRKLSPRQLEQVSLMRKVIKEEKRSDDRSRNLIVKEIDEPWKCKEAWMKIWEKTKVEPLSMDRLGIGKSRGLIRMTCPSHEDVDKIRKLYVKASKDGKLPFSIRADLCESELQTYRLKWKEAIRRNDEAKKKIWGVRNLELVQLKEAESGKFVLRARPRRLR